ncbi:hypothetical protein NR798_27370 [Archangium gephyra]|uniref:hypothetical protein n=1 Tax=Archangium gephyra TaxID=48 RepID=UPI0035D5033E
MRTSLMPLHTLPDFPLSEHEPLAQGFLALGLRRFVDIRAWAARRGLDAERIWRVREACIAALGD